MHPLTESQIKEIFDLTDSVEGIGISKNEALVYAAEKLSNNHTWESIIEELKQFVKPESDIRPVLPKGKKAN
ncbi:hypothetical protein Cal7507_1339 [Calothrix sp. PCC 7507]|nr:hypothetical protein Cal7507_1339 [Calothrix sp. PCC 7507]